MTIFLEILKQDLINGQHRNPADHPDYFTTTIFQLPTEMKTEIEIAGFKIEKVVPVEGPGWTMKNFEERWNDPIKKKRLMEVLSLIEDDEQLLTLTQHYIVIGSKEF